MISPLPGVTACKPGSAMRPLPGISAKIVDDDGNAPGRRPGERYGYLVLDKPWPSMLRGIWGDPERFIETYWSRFAEQGWYFAGDGARYDEDGEIWVLGRIDDVMNVSGHRISTTEVESALVGHAGGRRGGGGRRHRRHDRAGDLRVRDPALRRREHPRPGGRRCARRWPRRSARSPSRARSTWCRSCRRPAAARSCADCCATSPRAANSATYHAGRPDDHGPDPGRPRRPGLTASRATPRPVSWILHSDGRIHDTAAGGR